MTDLKLTLAVLPETLAVCRLARDVEIPAWALAGFFCSVTRTPDELSIVCPQKNLPEGITLEGGWRCLKVEGRLDFSLTGVLASITAPLAQAGISIFAVSTYQTDYLMVKEEDLGKAIVVLSQAGHQVQQTQNSHQFCREQSGRKGAPKKRWLCTGKDGDRTES